MTCLFIARYLFIVQSFKSAFHSQVVNSWLRSRDHEFTSSMERSISSYESCNSSLCMDARLWQGFIVSQSYRPCAETSLTGGRYAVCPGVDPTSTLATTMRRNVNANARADRYSLMHVPRTASATANASRTDIKTTNVPLRSRVVAVRSSYAVQPSIKRNDVDHSFLARNAGFASTLRCDTKLNRPFTSVFQSKILHGTLVQAKQSAICLFCFRTITFERNDGWFKYLARRFKIEGQAHRSKW